MTDNKSLSYLMDIDKNNKTEFSEIKSKIDNIDNKVTPVQEDMAQLVENVQKQVDELRTIVENSPAGIPAPEMYSLSSQSTEDGIKLTYQCNTVYESGGITNTVDGSPVYSMTKGVEFRYSESEYPQSRNDGIFALKDEDLFTVDENGAKTSKEKTYTIVGLSNGKTYFISAFPYSNYNVYNESCGSSYTNRTKCQWTGTKGTLTVNVTQDYDYKPLGEYTATMTPTAGGQAITKTQSGAATIVFSGLEAGEYTLSFSAPQYFTAPSSQSVTVVAGQSQTVDKMFEFTASLNDLSWSEIIQITRDGNASEIFAIGSTKDTTVGKISGDMFDMQNASISQSEQSIVLVDIDHHTPINTNTKHHLVFCTKASATKLYGWDGSVEWTNASHAANNSSRENYCYEFRKFLSSNYKSILPELSEYLIDVTLKTVISSGQTSTTTDKLFVPSYYALGGSGYGVKEEDAYRYFNSNYRRKSIVDETEERTYYYASRTTWISQYTRTYEFCVDLTTGQLTSSNYSMSSAGSTNYYRPLCFCIG